MVLNHIDRREILTIKDIRIKKNAWIGSGAIILPGITIGENVNSIGNSAFINCENLTNVTIDSKDVYNNATSTSNAGGLLKYATKVRVLKTIVDGEGNSNTYLNGSGFTKTNDTDELYYLYTKNN